MSDDPTQFPDDPAASESQETPASEPQVQPEAPQAQVTSTPAEPVAAPQPSEQVQYPPVPETYIQPAAAQPQYPPMPELYRQQPGQPETPNPYAPQQPPATPNPSAVPYSAPQAGYPMSPYTTPYSGSGFPPPFGYAPIPQAQPLPLGQAIRELPSQYKKILFKPGAATFAAEQGKAEWGIIWIQILILAVFQAVVSFVTFFYIDQGSGAAATTAGVSASVFSTILQIEALLEVVLVPAFFFAGVGIQYLFAKMFKGQGLFRQQAYNQLLYQVPLGIISSALSVIISPLSKPMMASMFTPSSAETISGFGLSPGAMIALLLIDLVTFGLFGYSVVLNIFAIMAAHRLSGGKATGVVLIPYGIGIALGILAFCGLFIIAISAAASMH